MSAPFAREEEFRGKPMIRVENYGGYRRFVFGINNGKKAYRLAHCWDLLEEFVESSGNRPRHNAAHRLTNSFGEVEGYCVVVPGYTNNANGRFYNTPLFTLRGSENPETDPETRADFQFAWKKADALLKCKDQIQRIILRHYTP